MNQLVNNLLGKDVELFRFIYSKSRCRLLDFLMPKITHLADFPFLVILISSLFLLGAKNLAFDLALTLGGSNLLIIIIKQLTSRKRPYQNFTDIKSIVAALDKYSFPSGHTTAIFTLITVLITCFSYLAPFLIILACLIALSRIYLGAHYPLDTFCGALIGISFALIYLN